MEITPIVRILLRAFIEALIQLLDEVEGPR